MASCWLMQIQFCTFWIWPCKLAEQNSKMCRICISRRDAIERKPFFKNILFLKLNFVLFCRVECWPVVGGIHTATWSYKSLPFSTTKESCDIWRGQKGQKVPKNKIPSWRRGSKPWICLFQQFKNGHQHNCQIHAYGKIFSVSLNSAWLLQLLITGPYFPASSSFKKKSTFLFLKQNIK